MHPSVQERVVAFQTAIEGDVDALYLDLHVPDRLVTCAIGCLVDPIELVYDVPFVWPDGRAATRDEIVVAWHAVKARPDLATKGWRAFLDLTPLRITAEGIAKAVQRRIDANEAHLRQRFAAWDSWPADAQLGWHSIAWAAGAGAYMPHMQAAMASPSRFDIAAGPDGDPGSILECRGEAWLHDSTVTSAPGVHPVSERITNPGLRPRNLANKLLFANAWRVQQDGLDPEHLYWPGTTHSP